MSTWPARVLFGMAVAGATALALLQGADAPSPRFWEDNAWLFYLAVAVLAVGAGAQIIARGLLDRSLASRRRIEETLRAAHVRLVNSTGIDWQSVGLHAYLLRHRLPAFWRPQLAGVARWRMTGDPPLTGISWHKGKGVIGLCWEIGDDVGVNLTESWDVGLTEAEWSEVPDEDRFGLTFEEYERSAGYEAIVATPIQDRDGSFIGCVSVDGPSEDFDALFGEDGREALHDAALTIRNLLE